MLHDIVIHRRHTIHVGPASLPLGRQRLIEVSVGVVSQGNLRGARSFIASSVSRSAHSYFMSRPWCAVGASQVIREKNTLGATVKGIKI